MQNKLNTTLIVCGTLCAMAPLWLAYYLVKQLAPLMSANVTIRDIHLLVIVVAGLPASLTFAVGVILILNGLRRSRELT